MFGITGRLEWFFGCQSCFRVSEQKLNGCRTKQLSIVNRYWALNRFEFFSSILIDSSWYANIVMAALLLLSCTQCALFTTCKLHPCIKSFEIRWSLSTECQKFHWKLFLHYTNFSCVNNFDLFCNFLLLRSRTGCKYEM